MQKEYGLSRSGRVIPVKVEKKELKVNIMVFNCNCEGILYRYFNIPESRIAGVFEKERKLGNHCEVE